MYHAEFNDPRLVAVYDAECPWSRDDDFFVAVANRAPGSRVLDLGCGTGRLALGLAAAGHTVTGVDPARASLDAARTKPGAERVFDARDPDAREWERWSTDRRRSVRLPDQQTNYANRCAPPASPSSTSTGAGIVHPWATATANSWSSRGPIRERLDSRRGTDDNADLMNRTADLLVVVT